MICNIWSESNLWKEKMILILRKINDGTSHHHHHRGYFVRISAFTFKPASDFLKRCTKPEGELQIKRMRGTYNKWTVFLEREMLDFISSVPAFLQVQLGDILSSFPKVTTQASLTMWQLAWENDHLSSRHQAMIKLLWTECSARISRTIHNHGLALYSINNLNTLNLFLQKILSLGTLKYLSFWCCFSLRIFH